MSAIFKRIIAIFAITCFLGHSVTTLAQTAMNGSLLPNTTMCELSTKNCVDTTPCKTMNGDTFCLAGVGLPDENAIPLTDSCWEYRSDYTCYDRQNDCLSLQSDFNCTELKDSPVCNTDESGNVMTNPKLGCMDLTHTFSCVTKQSTKISTERCNESFSDNGLSWSQKSPSAQNQFILAVIGRQIQNEISQTLQAGGLQLFAGDNNKCTIKIGGLKNCCSGDGGGGGSNQDIATSIGLNVAYASLKYGATYAVQVGSPYIYDSLSSTGATKMAEIFGSATSTVASEGGSISLLSGGFGLYGFGTTATAAEGILGSIGGSAITGATVPIGPLYFNPYALAFAVAVQVVMTYMQCSQEDAQTMASVSRNLCHYAGSYCSNSVLGICFETKQSYCCYNGILGLEIQEGAHNQLGLDWGRPQSPNCGGLSVDQVSAINFSMIDFSQFESQVRSNMKNFDGTAQSYMKDTSIQSSNKILKR